MHTRMRRYDLISAVQGTRGSWFFGVSHYQPLPELFGFNRRLPWSGKFPTETAPPTTMSYDSKHVQMYKCHLRALSHPCGSCTSWKWPPASSDYSTNLDTLKGSLPICSWEVFYGSHVKTVQICSISSLSHERCPLFIILVAFNKYT